MLKEVEVNQLLNEFAEKVKNQYNIEPTQEITGARFVSGIDICVEIDEDANYFNLSLIKVLSAIIDENKQLKEQMKQIVSVFDNMAEKGQLVFLAPIPKL
jgi:hypothetical protein